RPDRARLGLIAPASAWRRRRAAVSVLGSQKQGISVASSPSALGDNSLLAPGLDRFREFIDTWPTVHFSSKAFP
ncbi:MAG: hypothetical protein AB7L76_02015, partial [Burkholderiaceae bacterium]